VKRLLGDAEMRSGKQQFQTIARMGFGLRRSWLPAVHEENGPPYGGTDRGSFTHGSLHVYQRALQLFQELEETFLADENGRPRYLRRIDEFATSLVLNIAEGNGRFSRLDHGKFIDIAEEAGMKLAAYLDLTDVGGTVDMEPSKSFLR
jgi:hypothetical protein